MSAAILCLQMKHTTLPSPSPSSRRCRLEEEAPRASVEARLARLSLLNSREEERRLVTDAMIHIS